MIVAGPHSPVSLQIMLHTVTRRLAPLPSSKGIINQLFNFLLWGTPQNPLCDRHSRLWFHDIACVWME